MTRKEQNTISQTLELSEAELAGLSAGVDQDSINRVQRLINETRGKALDAIRSAFDADNRGDVQAAQSLRREAERLMATADAFEIVLHELRS